MPSETTVDRAAELTAEAMERMRSRIERFHATVADAALEIAGELERRAGEEDLKGEQALIELGPFAAGLIDPDRFAQLLGVAEAPLTPEAVDVLARADAILSTFSRDPARHVVEVPSGGDLRDAVKDALAGFGRAYGAARAVEMARAGTFDEASHGHLLGRLPFRFWHRAERQLAPPLVVRVRGDDCLPVGLGEFLDGNLVVVLVAEGPTTPAPLARLITPGTFVMQTADPEALRRLEDTEHPAIALLFDEDRPGQACFIHDPDGGEATWDRMTIQQMPSEAEVGRGRRVPMWVEELEHLRELAEAPVAASTRASGPEATPPGEGGTAPATPVAEGTSVGVGAGPVPTAQSGAGQSGAGSEPVPDPVDRFAAWLLSRADLDEPAAPPADR